VAAAVLSFAFAATAQARTYVQLSFDLRTSAGEGVQVTGSDGQVAVASFDDTLGAVVGAEGVSNRRHLRAAFGDYGGIDMRFEPRGEPHVFRPQGERCSGHSKHQPGKFTGTFTFADQVGGVSAARASAKGALYIDSVRCRSGPGAAPVEPEAVTAGVELRATTTRDPLEAGTDLGATRLRDTGGPSFFFASRLEFQDPLVVLRWGTATSGRRGFDFNRRLTRASVDPPRPFAGSARYRKTAVGRTWSGDLALSLPGISIPLAGEGFHANLRRIRISSVVDAVVVGPRRLAQFVRSSARESGSQSTSRQASGIWSRSVTMPKSIFPR
jgi:hypothetical protein